MTRAYAEMGDPSAQYNMALLSQKGEGVKQDMAEAVAWYRKAAAAGFPSAQYNLGVLLSNGKGVTKDTKEAAKWFYAAAGQGVFEAQKAMIESYSRGLGVEKNGAQALTWDFLARRSLELRYEQPAGAPPKPAKLRADGFAEYTTSQGQREAIGPDGSVEKINADGTKTVKRADGGTTAVAASGERETKYPDGRTVTEYSDGRRETRLTDGGMRTEYPDGRKVTKDRNGTVETLLPDGTREIDGDATTTTGRHVRLTEKFDKDGKRVGRHIVDGLETIDELPDGTRTVATTGDDEKGRKVRVIDSYGKEGTRGPRRLVRDDGVERTGEETWVIKRWVKLPDGKTALVKESYGLGNSIQDEETLETREPPPVAAATPRPQVSTESLERSLRDAGRMGSSMRANPPVPIQVLPSTPVVMQMPEQGVVGKSVYRAKVNIDEQLAELAELERESRFFVGASDADYERARAMAQRFVFNLAATPQKPQSGNWLNQRIAEMAAPPPPAPLRELTTDRSEAYPLGLYGREIIKAYPWKHSETEHFVVHYTQSADAYPAMRYIECAFFVVTQTLQIDTSKSKRKSHVFIFPDSATWKVFTQSKDMPSEVAGFAYKDELLLGAHSEKDTYLKILCHEATHAVVAHFYPGQHLPLWLNEGFADYMGAKSLALRRGHKIGNYLATKPGQIAINDIFNRIKYGDSMYGNSDVVQFYAQSEKCVRVLLEKLPPGGFPRFANLLFAGNATPVCLRETYGAACADAAKFETLVNSTQ